jgi:hypothetical protein
MIDSRPLGYKNRENKSSNAPRRLVLLAGEIYTVKHYESSLNKLRIPPGSRSGNVSAYSCH